MAPRYWFGLDRWVDPLGLGCWQLGGDHEVQGRPNGWGPVSEEQARELVHHALDHGIRFFDTAIGYGDGRSEELLGRALHTSAFGEDATICTKAPLTPGTQAIDSVFLDHVHASLERLRRDRIDILLLHNPPDDIDWSAFDQDPLRRLQADGLIGTFGVSSRSLPGAQRVLDARFGTCIEWVYGPLERRPAADLLPRMAAANMNFIARSPLSRGYFTGALHRHPPTFAATDFRSTLPAAWREWVRSSIDRLALEEHDIDRLANLAIAFCLHAPEVTAVIPGMKHLANLQEYLRVRSLPAPPAAFLEALMTRTEPCFPGWA